MHDHNDSMTIAPEIKAAWENAVPEDYRQEPAQMPSGAPGKEGFLRLDFTCTNEKSILHRLDKRTPLFAQKALYHDEGMPQLPCVTMISTSGCVLQGDRLMLEINVGEYACAHVATQSATKIHSMDANYAAQAQHIRLAENAYLEFMPDPLILHRHARFINDTRIERRKNATLIYSEVIIPGRLHHRQDELFGFDFYSSTIAAADENGSPLFKEKIVLRPNAYPLNVTGVMGDFQLYGCVIVLTDKHHIPTLLQQCASHYSEEYCYGVSILPGEAGVIFKTLDNNSTRLKQQIRAFWQIARKTILGLDLSPPFIWKK